MNPGTPHKGLMHRLGQTLGVLLVLALILGVLVLGKLAVLALFS